MTSSWENHPLKFPAIDLGKSGWKHIRVSCLPLTILFRDAHSTACFLQEERAHAKTKEVDLCWALPSSALWVWGTKRGSYMSRRPGGAGYALVRPLGYFQSCVWAGAPGASRCLPSVLQVLTSLSGITPGVLSKNATHLPRYILKSSMRIQVPLRGHHSQVKGRSCVSLDEFGVTLKGSSFHIFTVHVAGRLQAFRLTQLWLLLCP